MSIKVGVRVRPFNTREKDKESVCIIDMVQNQTIIKDELGQEKKFTFDHSFWSHDGFTVLDNGYFQADDEKYSDQTHVFNAVGKQILDNAWEGYHCCLFAYGQTGSGKSYSMVGYGENKGIVPISCEEIFTRINSNSNSDKFYQVQVSMLEIYNEKVQDLLTPASKRPQQGLKIRESKVLGIFVEGLTKHPVTSYTEISNKMDEGYENRTIGSTLMNATSSRAHTIVTIEFKQIETIGSTKSEKLSMINLVDLAGSERAGSTGATGDRLKEGCNINKSLLVLGNVINALADKALGKKKDILPPYRDSALTRILQNALGGNSKTVMICALSPASINYEETLSTLRYADRAKKIQNKAIINESEHDKMVRMLKEENGDLKKKIEELSMKLLGQGGVAGEDDKQAFIELREQYDANQKEMANMEKTFEQKLEEAKKLEKELIGTKVDIKSPHLIVLNEDPQLSHKLRYSLQDLPVYVGRKHGNPTPQITLSGIGIKQNHAIFIKDGDDLILKPNDKDSIDYIYINGKKIPTSDGQKLNQKDRITFGTNTIVIFMKSSDGKDIFDVDWENAQLELQTEIEKYNKLQEEANERRKQEEIDLLKKGLEEEYSKKKNEMEDQLKKQVEDYQLRIKEMNQNAEKQRWEAERINQENLLKQKIEWLEAEKAKKKREFEIKERNELVLKENSLKDNDMIHKSEKLENTLMNIWKKISKMKIIMSELKRNINLDVFLSRNLVEQTADQSKGANIVIRVENYEEGTVYFWTTETFHNRYDLMKEWFNKFNDEEDLDIINLKNEDDPWWDEPQKSLLGYAFYKLEPVVYLMSNESSVSIISPAGIINGEIDIDIIPHDADGNEYDTIPEQPAELIGQSLNYKVSIIRCRNWPAHFCKNLQVEYKSFYDNIVNQTAVYNGSNMDVNVEINEHFEHRIEYLTKDDIDYFEKDKLCFKIYAYEEVEKKGKTPKEELIQMSNEENVDMGNYNSNSNYYSNNAHSEILKEDEKKVEENKKKKKEDKEDPKGKNKKDCIIF